MKDWIIKVGIIIVLVDLMWIIFFACGCTPQREIYTRNYQLHGHDGHSGAILYKANRFYFDGGRVTRVNEYGDTFSYSKEAVKVTRGEVHVSDEVGTIIYRP